MKAKFKLAALILVLMWTASAASAPRDSTTILVLSPRVGPTIDAAERDFFRIFPQFNNFYEAAVFRREDGRCFVRITLRFENGVFRDTVVAYGEHTLFLLAEKINHFEDLENGGYRMGEEPSVIKDLAGEDAIAPMPDSTIVATASTEEDGVLPEERLRGGELSVGLASGVIVHPARLSMINDSLVTVESEGYVTFVAVDSIVYLHCHEESHFWAGAGIGSLAGAGIGALIGLASYSPPKHEPGKWFTLDFGPGMYALGGAMIGMPIGFLVGGIIGASTGEDSFYHLAGKSRRAKTRIIQMAMLNR